MQKFWVIFVGMMFVTVSYLNADTKRYDVKSGQVTYSSKTSGSTFGIKTDGSGTNNVYFKEWGKVEVNEGVMNMNSSMGAQNVKTLQKIENGISYNVDFENKVIMKMTLEEASKMVSGFLNLADSAEEFLKKNGGKKIGKEKVLGYICDVWTWKGGKVWLYKGVMLKSDVSMMGVNSKMVATKARFNTTPKSSKFKLPNYPIKTMSEMMGGGMPSNGNQQVPENTQMEDMQKAMGQMMELLQKQGQ